MKIAVLSRKRTLYSTKRIIEEIKHRGFTPQLLHPLKCDIVIGEKGQSIYYNKRRLSGIKCIIPRIGPSVTKYGLSVIRQFVNMGIPSVGSPTGIEISRDKFRCMQLLSENGVDVPKTALVRDPKNLKEAVKRIGGVPVIIKTLKGTHGKGVIYVESLQGAASTLEALWGMGKSILIQQFIIESRGTDIRCFVVDGKVVASYKRIAQMGEFRSNYHMGAICEPIALNTEQKKIAINTSEILNLKVAGVDLIESSDGLKVLEVNSSPGFQGLEKALDVNIAQSIVEYAASLVDGN